VKLVTAVFRLQDEYAALQKELRSTIEDSRLVQEKYTKLLDDARSQLAAKIAENEQLKTQVLNDILKFLLLVPGTAAALGPRAWCAFLENFCQNSEFLLTVVCPLS